MESKLLDGHLQLISSNAIANGRAVNTANAGAVRSYQAAVDGTGAVTATVVVEVSNDGAHWEPVHTFTLSGTMSDQATAISQHTWAFTRARVTAISGTGAVAACVLGV